MNRCLEFILNALRYRIVPKITGKPPIEPLVYINDVQKVNNMIKEKLLSNNPCMIARYGSVEVATAVTYLDIKHGEKSYWKYITGRTGSWWWQYTSLLKLQNNAGFFPISEKHLEKYAKLIIEDSKFVDILGSMAPLEHRMDEYLGKCPRVRLRYIEPDFFAEDTSNIWIQSLKGKTVLVVHPYTETIIKQYKNRRLLFRDPNFLPDFNLITVKAVQSLGGNCHYKTWFEALEHMEQEMDKCKYDIAIIGCGAYGFHLAAHAKRTGHKAIHMGGATQLLFGITGKRWEERDDYKTLINQYWCRPNIKEKPSTADMVENGCYW